MSLMRSPIVWCVLAGIVAAVAYVLSPMTVVTAVLAAVLLRFAGRGLPADERRWLAGLLLLALALRAAAVATIFLAAPHDDQAVAVLSGDEAQMQSRAMRMRDIIRGVSVDRLDYIRVFDEYGQNSYNTLLADTQVLFGPSPYGMRLVNALFFVAAATLLFRVGRHAFGALPALGGLAILLFVPTLFAWSISLLKESLYCLLTTTALAAALVAVRRRDVVARLGALTVLAIVLWSLNALRPGAVAITASGLAIGAGAAMLAAQPRRVRAIAIAVLAALTVSTLALPAVRRRADAALEAAAKVHIGHVFTVGHSYKLLDGAFYVHPRPLGDQDRVPLTRGEAARYLVRATMSFVLVPLPWQIATRSELAFLPEQLLWYAMLILAAVGVRAAFRADPLVAALLVGVAATAASAVALTNGNVGTLIRFRGLVTPYAIWISAVGFCVTIRAMLPARELQPAEDGAR